MANEKQSQSTSDSAPISLTATQLSELIRTAIIEAKAPYVDEQKAARAEKSKAQMRAQIAENVANKKAAEDSCTHLRDDNTARIAWAVNFHKAKGLYIKEGYCQACNKEFKPGVDQYEQYLRIPTGRSGIVY